MVHLLAERLPCSHEARGGGFDRWQQEQPRLAADPSQSKMALEREKGAKQDSNHVPTSSNFADNKKLGFANQAALG